MNNNTKPKSGEAAVSIKKRQRFMGECMEGLRETDLIDYQTFYRIDFAFELRADKLLLFTVYDWMW